MGSGHLWRFGYAAALTLSVAGSCRGQVAFQPVPAPFASGANLSATPVVSWDRRYVRLVVAPMFTDLQGFDTLSVPAAVGGGGINGGGGAGGVLAGLSGTNGPLTGPTGVPMSSTMEPVMNGLDGFAPPDPMAALFGNSGLNRGPAPDRMPQARRRPRPARRGRAAANRPAVLKEAVRPE